MVMNVYTICVDWSWMFYTKNKKTHHKMLNFKQAFLRITFGCLNFASQFYPLILTTHFFNFNACYEQGLFFQNTRGWCWFCILRKRALLLSSGILVLRGQTFLQIFVILWSLCLTFLFLSLWVYLRKGLLSYFWKLENGPQNFSSIFFIEG